MVPEVPVQAVVASALASYTAAGVIAVARVALSPTATPAATLAAAHVSLPLSLLSAGVGAAGGIALLSVLAGRTVLLVLYTFMWLTSAAALGQIWVERRKEAESGSKRSRRKKKKKGSKGGRHRLVDRTHRPLSPPPLPPPPSPSPYHSNPFITNPLLLTTGCLSALTGTSGPVCGIPLLLLSRHPPALALLLSQSVQLPIAALSTLAVALLDPAWLLASLAVPLALGQAVGVLVGMKVAAKIDAGSLKLLLSSLLLLAASVLLARLLLTP
jgi:uncharacterized membrane protein YfcA